MHYKPRVKLHDDEGNVSICFSCLSMFISGTNDEKGLKIPKKQCLQNCLHKEFIWKCSKKRFKIYAKFLNININFQNTGKALIKFNKNRVSKNDLLEIICEVHF